MAAKPKPKYIMPGKDRFGEARPVKDLRTRGTLKQRDLDQVVNSVGGRKSRIADEARAVANDVMNKSKGPLARARARAFEDFGKSGKTLVKGVMRGMLSPAGMAEGVAGAAAKRATEAKFKREAREQDKPTKGGMRRVKTKA